MYDIIYDLLLYYVLNVPAILFYDIILFIYDLSNIPYMISYVYDITYDIMYI